MSVTKKMQRNATIIKREMRATPWREAFSKLARLPSNEIVDLFDCLLDLHGSRIREFIALRLSAHYTDRLILEIGVTFSANWDLYITIARDADANCLQVLNANSEGVYDSLPDELSLADVLHRIKTEINNALVKHVRGNIANAVDVFKLAHLCDLQALVPVKDLDALVKFFASVARKKRNASTKRVATKKLLEEAGADTKATNANIKTPRPKSKPATKLRGFLWREAVATTNLDVQGFILMEQADKSWLVTYNNHAPLKAWSEDAAKELVSDIVKDPNRLREFAAIPNIIKEGTIIRHATN